jgi:sugar/nucleoside kinase (ribokinase family)
VYLYVNALGKASKEYTLATVEAGGEHFLGGIEAASKQGEWRRASIVSADRAITKTRYVDKDFSRKLFEVYDRTDLALTPKEHEAFTVDIAHAADADMVIVFDFGHGLLDAEDREVIAERFPWAAVNAQTNAGNHGFNPVTKYCGADFICIDEPEARLATSMAHEPIDNVVDRLAEKVTCPRFLITRGRGGSYFRESNVSAGYAPVLSAQPVDTIGAGDAVMAVTAPLIAAGLDTPEAALVGNVVGALKVSIVGHRRHVTRQEIVQTLETILK